MLRTNKFWHPVCVPFEQGLVVLLDRYEHNRARTDKNPKYRCHIYYDAFFVKHNLSSGNV